MSVSSEMRVRRRVCRVDGCAHLAVSYERECFGHLEIAAAQRVPAAAVLEEERDRRIRLDDAEFVRGLGRLIAPGLALAIAHWEDGPHVGVCGYGACTRTQVAGSPYCRLHGGLVR